MTDTTITPEERAAWLKDAQPKSVSHYEPIDFEMDKRIRRLLTTLEAAEASAEKAEAESDRMRAELETARQVAASAQSVAEAAWGGEIPSPLPGHKHMTEDDLASMCAHLDCPLCGGSGHIGDCDATVASEVERLLLKCGEAAPEGTEIYHVGSTEYVLCPSCDYEFEDPWDEPEMDSDADGWHGVITCRNCSARIEVHSQSTHFWTAKLADEETARRAVADDEREVGE